ncbi:tetratricopeptide repeat protein, partial [Ancylostoma duodenale]
MSGSASENSSDVIQLTSMKPVKICDVGEADVEYAPPFDGTIGGMDVSGVIPAPSDVDGDYDRALGRFMRNEIDYDEFMRLTGGQTIEEEMAADGGGESMEDEEDYEYGTAEETQVHPVKSEYTPRAGGDLPVHIRNLMQEIVNDELGACRADALPSATPMETDEPSTSQAPAADSTTERERIPRKLSKTMDALLGHANVIYARGNTQEALAVLLEVIRQEPRNAASYRQVSDIYQELGDYQKSLQYGLLAAHLDPRTPAEDWAHWGDESKKLELIEEAAACYGRAVWMISAIRLDVKNWKYYENRIEMLDLLNLRPLAMRTRLQAAQMINPSQAGVDFEWFHELIKTVAQYYITINDEDRAILALEAFVLRSKEFGRTADNQHETLIGMWMAKSKFTEAAKSIFALCDGISVTNKSDGKPAMSISLSHGTYSVEPFPPKGDVEFHVDPTFSTITLSRLIVCFIGLGKRELATPLKETLLKRNLSNHADEPYVLEIARAFYNCDAFKTTKVFLESLQEWNNYCDNAEMWFIYGNTAAALKDIPTAMESFEKVLQVNPGHVDARINLSGLQQKIGQSDRALETLQDYDLDTCTHLPDERLLIRQADVLFDSHKTEQFVRCCRMLLTPHFYEVHRNQETI